MEQWLIDANNANSILKEEITSFCTNEYQRGINDGINIARHALLNCYLIPRIDPETMPIVRELRAELRQYKDLGVTPEQIALLMNFFKERTSAKWIATDMELVADSLQKGNLEKRLVQVTKERDVAVKERDEYKAALQNWNEGE